MIRILALSVLILFLFAARLLAQHEDHGARLSTAAVVTASPANSAATGATSDTELKAELEALRQSIQRYEDHAHAVADGFHRFGHELDDPLNEVAADAWRAFDSAVERRSRPSSARGSKPSRR